MIFLTLTREVEFQINFAWHVRHSMNKITQYFYLGFIRRKSVICIFPGSAIVTKMKIYACKGTFPGKKGFLLVIILLKMGLGIFWG